MADDLAFGRLSPIERAQLGTWRPLQRGGVSASRFVPPEWWPTVRAHLLQRSRGAAAIARPDEMLPARMTAYTPGETVALLQEPEVLAWHAAMRTFDIPDRDPTGRPYQGIVLVPCAKTKPWATTRKGLYGAYNEVRRRMAGGEAPPAYFVTISEPLGVVPESRWADFPQYDNPGLFENDVLRAGGLFTADWAQVTPVGEKFILPFDRTAYETAIGCLAEVIGAFLVRQVTRHPDWPILSFVDALHGEHSSHADMLDAVIAAHPTLTHMRRLPKKAAPRVRPVAHVLEHVMVTLRPIPASRRSR